jgi:hypothetical protein
MTERINGFLEAPSGNKSSTRLIGLIVIVAALIFAQEIIWFGRENIILAATGAGTIFLTIAGPVLAFLFKQKQNEIKAT